MRLESYIGTRIIIHFLTKHIGSRTSIVYHIHCIKGGFILNLTQRLYDLHLLPKTY